MFLRQLHDGDLAQYTYLIGCQKTGEAIVIDPQRDVDRYRALAKAEGLKLTAVAETHIHADFVSGARELAADPSIRAYLSSEGGNDWQSEWARELPNATLLNDSAVFHVGRIRFEARHTPGHTPEHLSYLVTDEGGGADEPLALLSGDFLFVGDAGRPDLLERAVGLTDSRQAAARQLYGSLRRVASLPCHLQILPAHGAGSACGKALGAVPSSTFGYEVKFNPALKVALDGNEQTFVDFVLQGQPEPPTYFARMKQVNRLGPSLLGSIPEPPELTLAEVAARLDDPHFVVLDTRTDRVAFLRAHLSGSLFLPATNSFSDFAGAFLGPDERVVLVAQQPGDVDAQVRRLVHLGFDQIDGWLGAGALAGDAKLLVHIHSVEFAELPAILADDPDALVLDVRRADEFDAGHLRGAINIAHLRLRRCLNELPSDRTLIVHCQSGNRAAGAAAYLARSGHRVIHVDDTFDRAPTELRA